MGNENIGEIKIKLIKLNHGKQTLVDDCDYDILKKRIWKIRFNHGRYSVRNEIDHGKFSERIAMHRFIMKPPHDMQVDHINGNPLDNRRANLRVCTCAENVRNRKPQRPGKYKGVHLAPSGRWYALIQMARHVCHLGTFPTPEEAAKKYNEMATKFFGEFARLNIIKK